MRKHKFIDLFLILVILAISFWNVTQQQEKVSLKESVAALNEKNKELVDKEKDLHHENERLSKQAEESSESLKKIQRQCINSGVDVDLNTDFINIVTKLFEANLNFTPKNYEDRKQEVSGYLSDELNKEYFGQKRNTYQDANGTISQLESLEVYTKGVQEGIIEGLVIVHHRSKQNGEIWTNGMNIFKVFYSNEFEKFVKIENLGSRYLENQK
ncbi:hypothetical protein [Enterococcus malodoratus]|uniref:Uncharacterized protein n=1 Tax=Enterococcus malodoratus ATCC 43197 TaxID=1158601 RepID=R2NM96_9ENTE|nr:hypothetical protein [Enterococcus malodoratus]EOH72108.1 hypothetical protein UAI_04392 [Enterococcus malodoratus ATCC 43197]EOT69868.1 hypothetical protein I585_01347 [Enterococcus malodoratus ATCC 43197]OJG56438.1 hypothetical protein RV07_GL004130 [Enterococcus malodoratus]STC70779.1 Uncharacterised protein [Enterococcus malodoratus]